MKEQEYVLYREDEYTYPAGFGFIPFLHAYLHEDSRTRPVMIIAPGGAYRFVAPAEGEIVARTFYDKGWNCFVLTYSTNMLDLAPLNGQPLHDISRAVRYVRRYAEKFNAAPDRLAVCGFSAAGHLCASLAVHYMDDEETNPDYAPFSNRPQAAVLSYPVISSGEFAHRDSFVALLGKDASEEMLKYMSLEIQVTKETVPCFLWATVTDDAVPVENSYFFSEALKKSGVPYALHIFSDGRHGLSVATEEWADNKHASPYTLRQSEAAAKAVREGAAPKPEGEAAIFLAMLGGAAAPSEPGAAAADDASGAAGDAGSENTLPEFTNDPNPEAAIWPELADLWLKKMLG